MRIRRTCLCFRRTFLHVYQGYGLRLTILAQLPVDFHCLVALFPLTSLDNFIHVPFGFVDRLTSCEFLQGTAEIYSLQRGHQRSGVSR